MLGFLTIVSLVVAFALGGWWWLGFVVLLLAWLGKRQETKEQAVKALSDDARVGGRATISSEKPARTFPPELIDICSTLSSHGYYIGDLIPEKKRTAAMENYPLPGDQELLALIDGTVFGSATKGFAVGKDGVAWKNGGETAEKLVWRDFARSNISSADHKVSIGTSKFDSSGSGIKLEKVEALLLRLKDYAVGVTAADDVIGSNLPKPLTIASDARPLVAVNQAEFDELLTLPGIGAPEAHMIVRRRDQQAFVSNEQLADYLALKPHMVARLNGLTDFGPALDASLPQSEAPKQNVSDGPKLRKLGGRTID